VDDPRSPWSRRAASGWQRRIAWALTALSVALNSANLSNVVSSVPLVHNLVGGLWLLCTHGLLALALVCALVPALRRRPLTRGGATAWLILALLSLLAFPVSYAGTRLFALGGIQRLF